MPHKGHFSKGYWCTDASNTLALKKPGERRPAGLTEAFREFICSTLASWLGCSVPPILLTEDPEIGPCSLSKHVSGSAIGYADVMLLPKYRPLQSTAQLALERHVGKVIVLDAWVGAEDRNNDTNHIYVEESDCWHSLDYGLSFNSKKDPRGVGDKGLPFMYSYLSDIKESARLCKTDLSATLKVARKIPEDLIKELVLLPPDPFASSVERRDTLDFLKSRQARLDEIVGTWWTMVGLPGAI